MMTKTEMKELKEYQKEATQVAKDFDYPQIVFENINKASTVNELSRVMHDARKYI